MKLKARALQLEEELIQLRQYPVDQATEVRAEPRTVETQNGRLIEVERNNATLVAEKAALQGQLQHLEGQLGSLQGRAQELLLQSQRAQEHSSRLQAEKSMMEIQGQELHRKLGVLEEEVRVARRADISLLVSAAEPVVPSHMLGILVGTLASEPGILAFLLAIGTD